MQDKVQIYRSITPGAAPVALLYGELAINIPDNRFWVGDEAGLPVEISLGESPSVSLQSVSFVVDPADGMDHHYRVDAPGVTAYIPDTLPVGHRFQIDCKEDTLIVDGNEIPPVEIPVFIGTIDPISDVLTSPIPTVLTGLNFIGGPVDSYSFSSDANGLVIDSLNGRITGTITSEGAVTTTVLATNETGSAVSNDILITGLVPLPFNGVMVCGNNGTGWGYSGNPSVMYGSLDPVDMAGILIYTIGTVPSLFVYASFELEGTAQIPGAVRNITLTLTDPLDSSSASVDLVYNLGGYSSGSDPDDIAMSDYIVSKDGISLDVNIIETI